MGGRPLAVAFVRTDEFDPPLFAKPRVERIAVVGAIADQTVGGMR